MKTIIIAAAGTAWLGLAACDVDRTQETKLPDVDVNVSGGQLPEFDVEGPEVNVGTVNRTVEVPTIDVDIPQEKEQ